MGGGPFRILLVMDITLLDPDRIEGLSYLSDFANNKNKNDSLARKKNLQKKKKKICQVVDQKNEGYKKAKGDKGYFAIF